jgi:RNA polymerase sigma-70 factor (ECF subfamily)
MPWITPKVIILTMKRWKTFRQQIENLNLLDKGIVMLYLDNKSYEEIAEIIGISKSNGNQIIENKRQTKATNL